MTGLSAVLLIFALAMFVLGAFELLHRKLTSNHKRHARNYLHVMLWVLLAFLPSILSFEDISFFCFLFLLLLLINTRLKIIGVLLDASHDRYGDLFLPVTAWFLAVMFPDPRLFVFGALIAGISDGLAGAIAGHASSKSGRSDINMRKVASVFFFLSAFVLALFHFGEAFVYPAIISALSIASVLTYFEHQTGEGIDELLLPPLAAALLVIFSAVAGI